MANELVAGYFNDNLILDDKIFIIWDAIPSEAYIEYPIGAGGVTYTALDDGFIIVSSDASKSRDMDARIDSQCGYSYGFPLPKGSTSYILPVLKNSKFVLNHNANANEIKWIRLYKAAFFQDKYKKFKG